MLNLSDKELDRLSREAAGQYEVEEDNLSWEKLKQQLDLEIGNTPSPSPASRLRVKLVIYSLLVLLMIGIGWLVIKPAKTSVAGIRGNENNQVGPSSSSEVQPDNSAQKEKTASKTSSERTLGGKSASSVSSNFKEETSSSGSSTQASSRASVNAGADKNKIQKEINSNEKSIVAESSANKNVNKNIEPENTGVVKKIPIEDKLVGNYKTAGNKKIKGSLSANQKAKNLLKAGDRGLAKEKNVATERERNNLALGQAEKDNSLPVQSTNSGENNNSREIRTSPIPTAQSLFGNRFAQVNDAGLRTTTAANPDITVIKNSGLEKSSSLNITSPLHIGLMLAPDISNVGSALPTKLSTTIGITFGYQLSRNLSVNTGLLYTVKNYVAKGYDFKDNAWGDTLDRAVGNCNMFEIPLTLRYDFGRIGKASFFVNGGLSSYLMKKEAYTYYWKWGAPTSDTTINTPKNYLFSMVTLSAGVEESLSKRLSIQAEPFVILPLTGIGFGNIQLSSYGINFTLRYTPALKKPGNKGN